MAVLAVPVLPGALVASAVPALSVVLVLVVLALSVVLVRVVLVQVVSAVLARRGRRLGSGRRIRVLVVWAARLVSAGFRGPGGH